MKRFYESPAMAVELFQVNRSVAACTPRGKNGFDEDINSIEITCDDFLCQSLPRSTRMLFSAKNGGCSAQVSSMQEGANEIAWHSKGLGGHSASVYNPVDDSGLTYYFYS